MDKATIALRAAMRAELTFQLAVGELSVSAQAEKKMAADEAWSEYDALADVPAIGLPVLYFFDAETKVPRAATITYVHNAGTVNLATLSGDGLCEGATGVPFVPRGATPPVKGHRCEPARR